jgi:hypothetical protein
MKRRKPMSNSPTGNEPPSFEPPKALGREIQAKIGGQLRAMHDDIVKQGVPDRFIDLLSRLDKTDEKKSD